jgi:hypothetical protein
MPWDEDSWGSQGNYTPAEMAADLAAYESLKRSVCIRSAAIAAALALVLAIFSRAGAIALLAGGACGIVSAVLLARGNERLVDRRDPRFFVLSSFLRIVVFAIVPVGLAVRGPVWLMAAYFLGYFSPVVLFAVAAPRAFERKRDFGA